MIIALHNRREADTVHALKAAGLSITTVRGRRRTFNVAQRIPVLTTVVYLHRDRLSESRHRLF